MHKTIQTLLFIALSAAAASVSQAATIRVGTSYSDVFTRGGPSTMEPISEVITKKNG